MEVKFIKETNSVEAMFDNDDLVTTDQEDLNAELNDIGIFLSRDQLDILYDDLLRNNRATMKLDDSNNTDKQYTHNEETNIDVETIEQEEEYGSYDAEKISNTVGVWLTTVLASGYRIEKAQVSRGYTLEEIEYSGNIRMNRKHICGPKIKILEMICDEITPMSSGCAGRRIISQESMTEGDYLYSRMIIEDDIVVHYRLKKQENNSNNSFLKI